MKAIVAAGLLFGLMWDLPASAQTSGASAQAAARELFLRGVEHLRAEDWEAARDAFQQSYDLSPRPNTLLNLAGTQARTGHLVEAVENYRVFLSSDPSGRTRQAAENALDSLEPRLAILELEVIGDHSGATLTLDGQEISWVAAEIPLPVNPGRHELLVEDRDGVRGQGNFSVREGDRRQVQLEVAPPAEPVEEDDGRGGRRQPPEEDPLWKKGWFWGVVGGAVALIVVGISLGVGLSDSNTIDHTGNFGPMWVLP